MDPKYISAFIKSISNVFSTMLQLPVEVGEPTIKKGDETPFDVSGIIGMSGEVVGSVVLSFPGDAAERIVAIFTGEQVGVDSEDFPDAIGELVNMVAGGAKGMFEGREVSISCPSVVVGKNHSVSRLKDVPCVLIPCSTDCGEVVIEVAIQDRKANEASAAPAQASA
ncbi:MAG: chemotaxis protein CheX [Phycisphaeraceae bacterium]|nr:chemotaxis protein CheX [Phycisphaeraceae bacterium]MCB9847267.1 chemotaxis protein CheX [Phycisphaeraceae bacterium]